MPRILVVAPNWIGDALMAQPLLARLREKRPGLRLEALAPEWVAPVVRRMPEISEVIAAPFRHGALELRRRWQLGRALRSRAYQQAIVLPNSWKSALVPFFADIPVRSGYAGELRYGLLNLTYKNDEKKSTPMPLHYARLSEPPGTAPKEPLPQSRLSIETKEIDAALARFGVSRPYAVFGPGAEYGPAKRWPYFKELSRKTEKTVLLLGAETYREICSEIPGTNLAGKTTLDEAMALIAGAEYVVSNDSGLMHLAAALGRPQVALFGSSSPQRTPPLSQAARVVWLRVECSPCFERVCPLGHFRCMREIGVDQVLAEIRELAR